MVNKVVMPRMGSSMEQGKIVRWLKKEGDRVEKGDMIAEIETEKVTIEIEAFASGYLRRIVAAEGDTVPVGGLIALIAGADEPLPDLGEQAAGAATKAAPARAVDQAAPAAPREAAPPAAAEPSPAPAPSRREGRILVSPVARRMAEERGVDLSQIVGTGPGGRIVKEDVESFVARPAPAPQARPMAEAPRDGVEEVGLSRMRRAIANQMTQSKQTVPHFYVTMEVDMTEALRMRQSINDLDGDDASKVSVNDLVVAAAARILARFPQVNASYGGDTILMKHFVNVGIAVAVADGLIVPVVRDADKKSLPQIAIDTKRLAKGAREGRLAADDVGGATFTVTNLGMFDVDSFLAIINPPESAILSIGAIDKKPLPADNGVRFIDAMKVTLACDHRVIDGATGARFLRDVKRLLEKPFGLVVER